jgi:hypothetical protein
MRQWTWDDEFGRFSVTLDGKTLVFTCEATARGEHEQGWVSGTATRTLSSLRGDVPLDILDEITAACASAKVPVD